MGQRKMPMVSRARSSRGQYMYGLVFALGAITGASLLSMFHSHAVVPQVTHPAKQYSAVPITSVNTVPQSGTTDEVQELRDAIIHLNNDVLDQMSDLREALRQRS